MDIFVLFLTLGGKLSVFPHWGCRSPWVFHIWFLLCWGMFPLNLLCGGLLPWMVVYFVKCFFCLLTWSYGFYFYFLFIFREREWEKGIEGTRERISNRATVSVGLNPMTLGSWPEPKLRVGCFTDWATQAPLIWVLSFLLLMWCIMLINLQIFNQTCIPGINPTQSWWMIFKMYCWILFASILLRIFASMFIRDIGLQFPFIVVSLSGFDTRVILAP